MFPALHKSEQDRGLIMYYNYPHMAPKIIAENGLISFVW